MVLNQNHIPPAPSSLTTLIVSEKWVSSCQPRSDHSSRHLYKKRGISGVRKAALLHTRAAAASVVWIIAPDPIGTSDKSGLLGPQVEGSPDRLHGVRYRRCCLSWSFDWDLEFLFSFQMTGSRSETGG